MPVERDEIRRGMTVVGSDGEKIGTIGRVVMPDAGGDPMAEATENDAGDVIPPAARSLPALGTTTDKGRGTESITGTGTVRGDMPTSLSRDELGTTPGAGGMNALRGYGNAGDSPGDEGLRPQTTTAPEFLEGAGGAGGISTSESTDDFGLPGGSGAALGESGGDALAGVTDSDPMPPEAGRGAGGNAAPAGRRAGGYFTVQDPGVLGLNARVLHIPFDAASEVVDGRLMLAISRDEAGLRYGGGASLENDEKAEYTLF